MSKLFERSKSKQAGKSQTSSSHFLRNQLTVRGSWNSSFAHDPEDDWHYVLEQLKTGGIVPERLITQQLQVETLEEGLGIMRNKTEEYGKIMICNMHP